VEGGGFVHVYISFVTGLWIGFGCVMQHWLSVFFGPSPGSLLNIFPPAHPSGALNRAVVDEAGGRLWGCVWVLFSNRDFLRV